MFNLVIEGRNIPNGGNVVEGHNVYREGIQSCMECKRERGPKGRPITNLGPVAMLLWHVTRWWAAHPQTASCKVFATCSTGMGGRRLLFSHFCGSGGMLLWHVAREFNG